MSYSESVSDEFTVVSDEPVERHHLHNDCEQEILKYKWIVSEKAGCDQGDGAVRIWVHEHWNGYLRSRWLEHLQGRRFWVELDRGDFGLLKREFREDQLLLDRIVDRLKEGQENLNIIDWACAFGVPMQRVHYILEAVDINSRRMACRFG